MAPHRQLLGPMADNSRCRRSHALEYRQTRGRHASGQRAASLAFAKGPRAPKCSAVRQLRVGNLQFEVVSYRLKDEYKVDCIYEPVNVFTAHWVECDDAKMLEEFKKKQADNLALDGGGHLSYLAPTRVNLSLTQERWPDIQFRSTREH